MSFQSWLIQRENGLLRSLGDQDFILPRLYKSMRPLYIWNDKGTGGARTSGRTNVGGVFNLEFSPEGNVLLGACEKKAIAIFDVIRRQIVKRVMNAHTSSVNCIKFLNDKHFATCSDDNTVALWDLRYLKAKMRSLQGHSNWVKSIEYSKKDNLLVTSSFDGCIFTWDINSYTEQGLIYQKVFHANGLMRTRLTPDCSKLIMSTSGGYLIVIHDLDLTTLHKDLCGFRPVVYRLMQMGKQFIPQAAKFEHVFSKNQKKNRVEFVSDFPTDNDAEVILALEIHPKGYCYVSRNISYDGKTEWLTVHDLEEEAEDITECGKKHCEDVSRRKRKRKADTDKEETDRPGNSNSTPANSRQPQPANLVSNEPTSSTSSAARTRNTTVPTFVPDVWAAEVTVHDRYLRLPHEPDQSLINAYNFVYAISSGVLPTLNHNNGSHDESSSSSDESIFNLAATPEERARQISELKSKFSKKYPDRKMYHNPKKLTYYTKELNKEKGFIKEPCFSSDGRIICSPYGNGVRFLGFSNECSVYPYRRNHTLSQSDRNAQPLSEILKITAHSDVVLSTKFSPREPLLVTGCRSGKVVWYQPKL
ncbi:DDB1- and CUL4-associated factor 10 homolog [Ceratitis capitata]|uniref:DDB1- and CUL4-associated factor 10 homolog n=1 Tax=Ceratitis capitata TaxID=7213 RepID=UPI000329E369|nr:DDB1- and CUL4-associated factor 10 homolog [Ceratitis capitata]